MAIAKESTLSEKYARKLLRGLWQRKDDVYVVHYACEGFDQHPGGTPPITAIVASQLSTHDSASFSNVDLPEDALPGEREKMLLEGFSKYVRARSKCTWVQWNTIDDKFGFNAIRTRCSVHLPQSDIPEFRARHGVAKLISDILGPEFIEAPFSQRLQRIAELNDFVAEDLLLGKDEPVEHAKGNFVAVRDSVGCKVSIICMVLEKWRDGTLKTDAVGPVSGRPLAMQSGSQQDSRPWWKTAAVAGITAALLVLLYAVLPAGNGRIGLLVGASVFLVVVLLDPARRYFRAFSVLLGSWSVATVVPSLDLKVEGPQLLGHLLTNGPPVVAHLVAAVLMVLLLVLDFRERSQARRAAPKA